MTALEPRNRLLLSLSNADRSLVWPDLVPVELPLRLAIEGKGETVEHVYFPDAGIISVVAQDEESQIEVGLIGREGMSGMTVVLSNHRSPHEAYVQMAGDAHRIVTVHLRAAMLKSHTLRERFYRYALVFMTQIAQTAFANAKLSVEGRLARWLLMASDREAGRDLRITHEFLAVMLGVRRPGVTDALSALEGRGLIRANRGQIRILRRKGLITLAGSGYGLPESEYERLLA